MPHRTAIVLGSGGAGAAYQAGVLKAVRELLPNTETTPFAIVCGASGGAINAAALAASAVDFGAGVQRLEALWSSLHAADVYCTGPVGAALAGLRGLLAFAGSGRGGSSPGLLDNRPLRRLLESAIDFRRIEEAIAAHALHSLALTCSGYASGQSVTFFQGRADLEPWKRPRRSGAHVKLTVDHVLASSAIPLVFPAVRLHREWFGDGAVRQSAPLSPAIRLGADRILVIGADRIPTGDERPDGERPPGVARVAGQALSAFYVDSMAADIERLVRTNRSLAMIPEMVRREHGLGQRHIDLLQLAPSQPLESLAAEHAGDLPWTVRALLRGMGAMEADGAALASCLLFESSYTRALIALGHADTLARADEVRNFLNLTTH